MKMGRYAIRGVVVFLFLCVCVLRFAQAADPVETNPSHWLMRWGSTSVWVVRISPQLNKAEIKPVLAETVMSLRGSAPVGSVILGPRFLSQEQKDSVKLGGEFVVFAAPTPSRESLVDPVWIERASPARIAAIKKELPAAEREEMGLDLIFLVLAALPIVCVASQISLRRKGALASRDAIRERSLASFGLCVAHGALFFIYQTVSGDGFSDPRWDAISLAPLYAYSAWAATDFLSLWVKGQMT